MWTHELIKNLEEFDYKVARDVDYWINSILGNFITEFTIEMSISYIKVEH